MPSLAKFCERMDYYCRIASVGYDWGNRWDVRDGGETDCSALVITCLREAGFDVGSATYTGNLSANLTTRGWLRLAPNLGDARPGDILLNDANHVAAVVSGYGWGATVAQASMGETGGVYGNQPGDQTGAETNEVRMYSYPWDAIIRWPEDDLQDVLDYMTAKVDPTGRGKPADMRTRLAWMAAKQEGEIVARDAQDKKIAAIGAKLDRAIEMLK